MNRMRVTRLAPAVGLGFLMTLATATAQDLNIPRPVDELERELRTAPMKIVGADISRPKAKGDITLKAEVSFGGQPPYRVKLRRSEPGAEDFNNRPRYDLAAYELQKLFLDPADYVVPPTALRTVPLSELLPYAPAARPTFKGVDEVFVVLQYWLHEVRVIADVYDAERFEADAAYARRIGHLNAFTTLIAHGDANVGNFLISRAESGARVFSIDNGIAFAFNESDREQTWKVMRVGRLPSDTVKRLRGITRDELGRRLGVVGQWRRENGHWVATPPQANLDAGRGVRIEGDVVQMGLTKSEIDEVWQRLTRLLEDVDAGRIGVSIGLHASPARGKSAAAASAAAPSPFTWIGIPRVVAFADVHGAYTELVALLQDAGVVDGDLRWSAKKAHVVSTGDLLDRGADSRKVMDLLMRLQGEAAQAGGRLHVVLGNHEAMNVLGDLRYVTAGEFAAYAADEDPAERARQKAALLARQPGLADAEFDRRFPPGYFGHRRLLGPDGRYGRWLLGLPVAIRVNDTVYMHGGPSSLLQRRSLEQLNRDYSAALANYATAESALSKAGLLHFEDDYARRPELARSRFDSLPPGKDQGRLGPLVERFRRSAEDPLLGPTGPNWYRGAALCNECAEADVLEPFLAKVGAWRVVVGHTTARNGAVATRFDGAVVKLDAGMNRAVYGGRPAALVSDAAGTRVVYASPTTASAPPTPARVPAEPLYLSSQSIGEDAVADLLARGSIAVTETCAPGVLKVRVSHGETSVEAVFEATDRKTVQHELAAWRLDRLLGLGLVPATVARTHAGKDGVLQGRPAHWASEQDRQNARDGTRAGLACQVISNVPTAAAARRAPPADGAAPKLPTGGHCDLDAQYQLAYVFDALIGNRARVPDRFLYDADTTMLFLSGHGAAFGSSADVAKVLEAPLARTGPELQERLRLLHSAWLQAALGESVSQGDIEALLKRRDRILELARPDR